MSYTEDLIREGRAERLDNGRVRVRLMYPVEHGSETIEHLELRRLKGKDMKALREDATIGDMLSLIGKIAGQPGAVTDELDAADLEVLGEVIEEVVGSFPPTGGGR